MHCARLDGAVFGGTSLSALDLSAASGLRTTQHRRASSVAVDTLVEPRYVLPPRHPARLRLRLGRGRATLLASGARVQRQGRWLDFQESRFSAAMIISAPPFYGEPDLPES